MADHSVVYIEKLQKYLYLKEENITSVQYIHDIQLINANDPTYYTSDHIFTHCINASQISQEDKAQLLSQMQSLREMKYLDISLVALKKLCDNQYLNTQLVDKAQKSLQQIEIFNKINNEFKSKFLSLNIPMLFEKAKIEYIPNEGKYYMSSQSRIVTSPLGWEEIFFGDKKITKNGREGFNYAINHCSSILESTLNSQQYQAQTDNSYVIYVKEENAEGFFSKNQTTAPFNQALSFHDVKAATRACNSRYIKNYQIWQTSSKFTKQMSSTCDAGAVLQSIIAQQEKQFLEESMKLQEVVDMKNKIEKYELLLQEHGIAYETKKIEKTNKVSKL